MTNFENNQLMEGLKASQETRTENFLNTYRQVREEITHLDGIEKDIAIKTNKSILLNDLISSSMIYASAPEDQKHKVIREIEAIFAL